MKTRIIIFVFMLLLSLFITTPKIQAQEKASGSSATFHDLLVRHARDNRAEILRKYLQQYNSPLAPFAEDFVAQADLYNIDWKLVAAISGVESTFGKAVPCTNAWGWAIPDKQHIFCFTSYREGIMTISRDLRMKYMNDWGATNIYSIGRIYAASPTWASHVDYFMNQIEAYALRPENQPLSISL